MADAVWFDEKELLNLIERNTPAEVRQSVDKVTTLEQYAEAVAEFAERKRFEDQWSTLQLRHRLEPGYSEREEPNIMKCIELELHSLLCTTSRKYAALRSAVLGGKSHSTTMLVSTIASVIASSLGIAVGLVTSIVAICLLALCQVGLNAMCRRYEQKHAIERQQGKEKAPPKKERLRQQSALLKTNEDYGDSTEVK